MARSVFSAKTESAPCNAFDDSASAIDAMDATDAAPPFCSVSPFFSVSIDSATVTAGTAFGDGVSLAAVTVTAGSLGKRGASKKAARALARASACDSGGAFGGAAVAAEVSDVGVAAAAVAAVAVAVAVAATEAEAEAEAEAVAVAEVSASGAAMWPLPPESATVPAMALAEPVAVLPILPISELAPLALSLVAVEVEVVSESMTWPSGPWRVVVLVSTIAPSAARCVCPQTNKQTSRQTVGSGMDSHSAQNRPPLISPRRNGGHMCTRGQLLHLSRPPVPDCPLPTAASSLAAILPALDTR